MARIRTIKPEFFTSEDICALPPLTRLLYISLWCEADKEGRLEWKPRTWKLRYFPVDDIDIDASARELVASGLVVRYGDAFAYIPTFSKHQHINPRESASCLPDPKDFERVTDASPRVDDAQGGREGKGKEGKEEPSSLRSEGHGCAAPVLVHSSEPEDPKKALYDLGRELLGKSSGGQVTKVLSFYDGDVAAATRALRMAQQKSDPREYVGAILRGETKSDDVLAETLANYRKWGVEV